MSRKMTPEAIKRKLTPKVRSKVRRAVKRAVLINKRRRRDTESAERRWWEQNAHKRLTARRLRRLP